MSVLTVRRAVRSLARRAALLRQYEFFIELRARGIACAAPVVLLHKAPLIRNAGELRFGRDVEIYCPVTRTQLVTYSGGILEIGDHASSTKASSSTPPAR